MNSSPVMRDSRLFRISLKCNLRSIRCPKSTPTLSYSYPPASIIRAVEIKTWMDRYLTRDQVEIDLFKLKTPRTETLSLTVFLFIALLMPLFSFAAAPPAGDTGGQSTATLLIVQLGVIIFAARIGGMLFDKLKLPPVLGELMMGVFIGPHLLGTVGFPGFPEGLFPLVSDGSALPVSKELYAFATIASVILLFMSGLETDIAMFLKYSVAGAVVGVGGVLASFLSGMFLGMWFLHTGFMDPRCLFLAIVSTATSVGITARILSARRKIDSPEGVVILAGAVIDDVLGIICLAVVVGITTALKQSGATAIAWGPIQLIMVKAFGIWLLFTALGLIFAHKIAAFLKLFKPWVSLSVIALGLAFLMAGIFEKAGLSLIIGAYIVGITLSKTDLGYVVRGELHPLYVFFVPVFFTVMGMLVDFRMLVSPQIMVFGALYTLTAVAAKFLGCGIPALFVNFNMMGASRIGLGMIPRGEVALIIAGIGLSQGILDERLFGASIMMTMLTTLIAPLLLDISLKNPVIGTRKEVRTADRIRTLFSFDSQTHARFVSSKLLEYLRNEGFFVHIIDAKERIVQVRHDTIFFTLIFSGSQIVFEADREDVPLVKTLMYEVLIELHRTLQRLKNFTSPQDFRKELVENISNAGEKPDLSGILDPGAVISEMKAFDKRSAIEELIDRLDANGSLKDKDTALSDVLQREESMSTGMQGGIALPHAASDGVDKIMLAVGISRKGIDFDSLDGRHSYIFVLLLAPPDQPHIQVLAGISSHLKDENVRQRLLSRSTPEDIYRFFVTDS